MEPLTTQAHRLVQGVLRPGEIAIDATAGNGHDTLFLSQTVGPSGAVFACDVQTQAIDSTRARLLLHGVQNVTLIRASHAGLGPHLPTKARGAIGAIMFNLGYLPGGDQELTTRVDTTLTALDELFSWLRPGGILTIIAYPGHLAGVAETDAVEDWCCQLEAHRYRITITRTSRTPPAGPGPGPGPVLVSVTIAQ